jgi:adenine-specific DNA-methyltransferase
MQVVDPFRDRSLGFRAASFGSVTETRQDGYDMTTTTRTERHRADPKKSSGIVYTPSALARFLADQAFDALQGADSIRVLDPACGDGELLLAAAEVARSRGIHLEALVGYDTDNEAIRAASHRLQGESNVEFFRADFLEMAANATAQGGLFAANDASTLDFDLVISNPPYVRTQTLGAATAQALGRRFGLSGRVDLYQAFAVAMIEALRPLGALGLLCSNKFLTNRAGKSMRQLLHQELELTEIVDLGDTKLFDAAVLPVIVSGRRSAGNGEGSAAFRSVYEAKPAPGARPVAVESILDAISAHVAGFVSVGERTFLVREGVLDDADDTNLPWNPIDEETRRSFVHIRRRALPSLDQFGKVRVGVKTTADDAFIRSDWDQLPESQRPEEELLQPLLTHRDVDAWHCRPGSRRILYPHEDRSGRAVPVSLSDYPRAATYLESHRERLESRSYVIDAGRQWYEIWVPQKPALWRRRKLVFPDIADSPRFAVDESGAVVNGDCYWMVVEDPDVAEVLMAVGNSSFCTWFYDSACGNFLYAGRRRFMTQYIERLPVPKPTPALADLIRQLRSDERFDELDNLIWEQVGLEKVVG